MNRLRFLRNEKGESLDKLAKFLNVTMQTISNYETEKRDMTPDTIIKLAEYFGVSTDYLLGKSDIRNPDKKIKEEFEFAYHKETEGLSEDEIKEALEFYKRIKYGKNKEKQNETKDNINNKKNKERKNKGV